MNGLSPDERELLSQVVAGRSELASSLAQLDRNEKLSAEDADALRNAIADELAATGVTDGKINARGIRLDNLIDRVGRLSYLFDG